MLLCALLVDILLLLPLVTGQQDSEVNQRSERSDRSRKRLYNITLHRHGRNRWRSRHRVSSPLLIYPDGCQGNEPGEPLILYPRQRDRILRDAKRARRNMRRQKRQLQRLNREELIEEMSFYNMSHTNSSSGLDVAATGEHIEEEFQEPDSCRAWMECQSPVLQTYLKQLEHLPGCPCYYPLDLNRKNYIWDWHKLRHFRWIDASGPEHKLAVYKRGAVFCVRSAIGQVTPLPLAAQHCCYDNKLKLITRGRAAGTPNLISPEWSVSEHYQVDVLPWISCKGDWTRYNTVRPPNNMKGCDDNPEIKEYKTQIRQAKHY